MQKYRLFQIDSFTQTPFTGNPAGVVLDAEGLSEQQMQSIARELNNSETAFVFLNNDPELPYDGEIRYFSPTVEVPICGHATVAAMYTLAKENNLANATLQIKTGAGILPFSVSAEEMAAKQQLKVTMTQGAIEISETLDTDYQQQIAKALGIELSDLNRNCPIQIASTWNSKVMVGINNRETLNLLTPDMSALTKVSQQIACNGFYVFCLDLANRDIQVHGRMFAPAIGIDEDPVTGNANGPLGAYLVENKLIRLENHVDTQQVSFVAQQGEAMGRTGHIQVNVTVRNGKPQLVKISGYAVEVFRTEISL